MFCFSIIQLFNQPYLFSFYHFVSFSAIIYYHWFIIILSLIGLIDWFSIDYAVTARTQPPPYAHTLYAQCARASRKHDTDEDEMSPPIDTPPFRHYGARAARTMTPMRADNAHIHITMPFDALRVIDARRAPIRVTRVKKISRIDNEKKDDAFFIFAEGLRCCCRRY